MRNRVVFQLAAGLLAFGLACSGGTEPPASVATVVLNATPPLDLVAGGTEMFSVTPKDAKGNSLIDRTVIWTSSDPNIASVAAGLVTGVALGSATITASVEGITASVNVAVKDGGVCGASGCTFSAQSNAVTITVPAGALTQARSLTVEKAVSAPASVRLMPNTAFDFGPSGITFAPPVTLTIKYNPANVVADSPEGGLQLYEAQGASWRVVPGSSVNLAAKTVSGNVSHLGTYAVLMQAKVASVVITGDLTPIPVVTTRQLTGTPKDDEGISLTRAVAWTSSNPAVASVDPSSGLVSAKTPGTVIITATSETKSATVSLNIVPGPPAKIVPFSGNNQSVAAGAAVPNPLVVVITDAGNNPIAGVAVTFTVSAGGGTILGGATTSNASGVATSGVWTLGTAAGPNSVTVTSPAITGVSAVFNAAAGAGPPTKIAGFAGNNQTATAGGLVATRPSVVVTDANNNPAAGFTVTFAPAGGSGAVTGGSAVTDAAGIATVGSWRLGTTVGPQSLNATGAGLTGSPVVFSATAVAPVASNLAGFAGNNQTAKPNFGVATLPSVIITDTAGIPVSGVAVTFAVVSGGGSVTGASTTSNANGLATVGSWILGSTPGANSLTASSGTLTGSPFTFNASAVPAPPTTIGLAAGDGQSAVAGKPVPIPPTIKVTDADGLGVANVAVTFAVRSGGGSITGANAVTNSVGIASVGSWILGQGGNSLTATVGGLIGSPVIFLAVGFADVQIVVFGDSNTDLGFAGTDPAAKVGSYVSSINPAIRLGPDAPNNALQLAAKIESRWKANRPAQSIKAVNHGIAGTSTGGGRTLVTSPNALTQVGGVTRFQGEVLGAAYPWNGGEGTNDFYPNGSVLRVQAFVPRAVDFAYISMGTNDIGEGTPVSTIKTNLETMIDLWIQAGKPPNHLLITTLPPRRTGTTDNPRIIALNTMIRAFSSKGVRVIDLAVITFSQDGTTWMSPTLHVTGDELHYAESVRDMLADSIVSIMLQETPP
ncbi:MAG: Ig-like domain-containing protein [Gemmatimonadaceae bacterium]